MTNTPMSIYPFKTPPYEHQFAVWDRSKDEAYHGLFMEMGTGKTKVVIDTAAYLYDQGKIDGLLIMAPKGTYRIWFDTEIEKHMPDHIEWDMHLWEPSKVNTQSYVQQLSNFFGRNSMHLKIFIMNVEGLSSAKGNAFKAAMKFMGTRVNVMHVVDESTCIKNPKAKRTSVITNIGKHARYRRIMTGMAIPNGPLDVFSQAQFLTPEPMGFSSIFSFRNEYAVTETQHLGHQRSVQKVVGYQRLEELSERLKIFCSLIKKEDCLDLPPKIYNVRNVSMSPEQQSWYDQMRDDMIIALSSEEIVSANIAIVQMAKLHQITCGFSMTDDGDLIEIPTPLWDEIEDYATEIQGKAIIWSPYRYPIRKVVDMLKYKFGVHSAVPYFGDTKMDERVNAVRRFQEDPECRFFIGTPQTGGFGLTLTAAADMLYIGNSFNLEHRMQSEDRAHRIGQTRSVTYTDLIVPDTLSEKILHALRAKKAMSEIVLNWREMVGAEIQQNPELY